jgi:hypothetical protein
MNAADAGMLVDDLSDEITRLEAKLEAAEMRGAIEALTLAADKLERKAQRLAFGRKHFERRAVLSVVHELRRIRADIIDAAPAEALPKL